MCCHQAENHEQWWNIIDRSLSSLHVRRHCRRTFIFVLAVPMTTLIVSVFFELRSLLCDCSAVQMVLSYASGFTHDEQHGNPVPYPASFTILYEKVLAITINKRTKIYNSQTMFIILVFVVQHRSIGSLLNVVIKC